MLALIVPVWISLAGLFLLLQGEFLAAAQRVVYAGAVMVLYVFVAAYVGNVDEPLCQADPQVRRFVAPVSGSRSSSSWRSRSTGSGLKAMDTHGPTVLGFSYLRRSASCSSSTS